MQIGGDAVERSAVPVASSENWMMSVPEAVESTASP